MKFKGILQFIPFLAVVNSYVFRIAQFFFRFTPGRYTKCFIKRVEAFSGIARSLVYNHSRQEGQSKFMAKNGNMFYVSTDVSRVSWRM